MRPRFDRLFTAYVPTAATGGYTTLHRRAEPCRVGLETRRSAGLVSDRAEEGTLLLLQWGPGYELPEDSEVYLHGDPADRRWRPREGTILLATGFRARPTHRQCELLRVDL